MKRLNNSITLLQHWSNVISVDLYQNIGVIHTVFFHMKDNEQQDTFLFTLVGKCLDADETDEQEEQHLSNAEFVIAIVGVSFIVVAVRAIIWLFCGC